MRTLMFCVCGVLALVLGCSREKAAPLSPEASTTAPAGVVEPSRGGTAGYGGASNAEETELIEWEGQPYAIDYGSETTEVHPRVDPTLRFRAWSEISLFGGEHVPISCISVTSKVEYRPYGDPKPFRDLETRTKRQYNWWWVELNWERSMPFAWEAQMASEHGWLIKPRYPWFTRTSSAGPVVAHEPMRILP